MIPDMGSWKFVKELAEFEKIVYPPSARPYPFRELVLVQEFPDPEGVLATAFASFRRYWEAAGHSFSETPSAGTLSFFIQKGEGEKESYLLDIKEDRVTLSSPDPEGIRRGIYAFIDLLLAEGGALPAPVRLEKKPFLAVRLGRCPFSPIKRWPLNTDELLDDVDYYPEAYLERLAHEGVNGIWIVTALRELGLNSFTLPDPRREERLAKLKRVSEKCRKYGVKVYLFMIEPFGVLPEDELLKSHPEFFGPPAWGNKTCYCPHEPGVQQYLRELFSSIFAAVPTLGGAVDIAYGERPTTCLSSRLQPDAREIDCLHKCGLQHNCAPIALSLKAMWEGMHSSAPEAELFAWFYMPDPEELAPQLEELASFIPEEVIAQFNFESGGEKIQLGRPHIGNDYWVSYTGPAARFVRAAEMRKGKKLSAKLQLGVGHELTCVPGIPAPSIAYRKYKAMKELGVGYVMQSWYIGNFPSVMSRAMGLLAFEEFQGTEEEFLLQIAKLDWGNVGEKVAQAYKYFGEAYENFPFSIMFQYYAPQNSFPLWKFHFFPELFPLAPPWKPNYPIGGDMIGEALSGFSIEEIITLLGEMVKGWKKGMRLLEGLREKFAGNRERLRDLGICEMLEIILEGTRNLFEFYFYRRELFSFGKKEALLSMKEIVEQQKALYKKAIPLLKEDSRLGFHGEALIRIFDEENTFNALMEAERSLMEAERLQDGKEALAIAFREKILEERFADNIYHTDGKNGTGLQWSYTLLPEGKIRFLFRQKEGMERDHSLLLFFTDLCGTVFPLREKFTVKGDHAVYDGNNLYHVTGFPFASSVQCRMEGNALLVEYPLSLLPGGGKEKYLRFIFQYAALDGSESCWSKGTGHKIPAGRLLLGNINMNDSFVLHLEMDRN